MPKDQGIGKIVEEEGVRAGSQENIRVVRKVEPHQR